MRKAKKQPLAKPDRFEITVRVIDGQRKHICAAYEQDDVVKRIMRSYAKHDPEVVRVRRLGVLPKRRVA